MREITLLEGQITQIDDCDYWFLFNLSIKWKLRCNYVKCHENKTYYLMHKIIAKRMGLNILMITDHKDRNTLNNQRYNLREATYSQNAINSKVNKNNKLGYKNITFIYRLNKYYVEITISRKKIFRKLYNTIEEAIIERDKILIKYYGEFANLD